MNKSITPDMIRLARESRGLTQKQMADKLGISQGNISKIENGTHIVVSADLLKDMSNKLNYPEEFFSLNEDVFGPSLAFVYHRSRRSLSRKVIEHIEALINIHRIVISRLIRSIEIDTNFPLFDLEIEDEKSIAKAIRTTWLLPHGPIKNLIQVIERAGGIVIKCDFGTPKIDALSQYIPGLPPLFFINKNIPCDRVRYSLAHELGHVLMHRIPSETIEDEANAFASEFLMPANDISASLNKPTLRTLAQLKPYWKVSMQSLLLRALGLKKITKNQSRYLWAQMSPYRQKEPVELDIPMEDPKALKKLIEIYTNEFGYTLPELAKVAALNPDDFRANYLGEERHLRLIRE